MNNFEIKLGLLMFFFFGNKICNVWFFFLFFIVYVDWELEFWIFFLKRKKFVCGISRVIYKMYGVYW